MKSFFKKDAEVLNHWIAFADQFQITPSEYYATLEKEVGARKVPKMEYSRIEFPEGGLLSEKRTYFRMLRERILFDVCAAPFGEGCFFSCRTAEIPLVVQPWQICAVILALLFGFAGALKFFGFIWGCLICAFLFVAGIYVMRNAIAMGLHDLDKTLIQLPAIGAVYEAFFRRETYHRIDSRLCYLHIIPDIVKSVAGDFAAEKGVKLIDQYELSPIFGELYKRSGTPPPAPAIMPEPRVSM